jgi:hypothetical protein
MIVEPAVIFGAILATLIIGSAASGLPVSIYIPYIITGSIFGYILYPSVLTLAGAASIPLAPVVFFGSLDLYSRYRNWRAKRGDYGDSTKWATELLEADDQHFELAVKGLSKNELKEVGIIADSKEELRELAVERFEENETENGETIPEDML